MNDEAKLAALLGSRICHDLISPIGAIGNGVELMQMSGAALGPEMGLIEESVTNANTRIRFFRIAFGSASPGQSIPRREVVEILNAMGQSGRLRYSWHADADRERAEVKLVFLIIQCLESSMPYGGALNISNDGEAWVIAGTAQKLKADPELWSILTAGATDVPLTAGTVHFALASSELASQRRSLNLQIKETSIEARF